MYVSVLQSGLERVAVLPGRFRHGHFSPEEWGYTFQFLIHTYYACTYLIGTEMCTFMHLSMVIKVSTYVLQCTNAPTYIHLDIRTYVHI